MSRGKGCSNCGVTQGWISFEECIGCKGETPANHDYYPAFYEKETGLLKPGASEEIKELWNKVRGG